jgi:hypothetical protein
MLNNTFGIKTGNIRVSDRKKDVHRLCIENISGMIKFCDEIGSLHPEKKLRLKKLKEVLLTRQRLTEELVT